MITLTAAEPESVLRPCISVIGVGGAGGNAVNNMIRSGLVGCDFIAANTDAQALNLSLAPRKVQLGTNLSRGLGAGSRPDIGRAAAEEQMADVVALLEGSDMLFVTAGMGGGTGTGAAPVIARAARENGILTVGVVTKPFHFEGNHRMRQAEAGITELQKFVDTLIVIPNQNLFRIANERTTFAEAFRLADDVLNAGVRGITDLMMMPGFMNLDFADVKTVMGEMGKAMMGTGESDGENRAVRAAEAAISNPLLDDISMRGARGVLINVTGGLDMTLFEMDLAANRIREEVDPDAQIKVGSTLCEDLNGKIRVSVIATGIDAAVELADQEKAKKTATGKKDGRGEGGGIVTTSNATAVKAPAGIAAAVAQGTTVRAATHNKAAATPATPANQPSAAAPSSNVVISGGASLGNNTTTQVVQSQMSPFSGVSSPYFSIPAIPVVTRSQFQSPTVAAVTPAAVAHTPKTAASAPLQRERTIAPTTVSNTTSQQTASTTTRSNTATSGSKNSSNATTGDTRLTNLTAAPKTANTAAATQNTANNIGTHINRRSQSLFTRITGFGMVRQSDMRDDEYDDTPTNGNPAARTGIAPTDRPALSADANEAMEIPAFLRRQTNH